MKMLFSLILFSILGMPLYSGQHAKYEQWNQQGLSEGYHGHVEERIEEPYKHIQLLGINDFHGQLNVTRLVNDRPAGRADYLAAYLRKRAAENENTLLLHAGDMIGASPPVSALLRDEPTIEFLNRMGFDIGTIGNHEFDRGSDELLRLLTGSSPSAVKDYSGSQFPWIAANVINQKSGKPFLPPYKIINISGIPIGFIGVIMRETPAITAPDSVKDLIFTDEAEAINKYTRELQKQGVRAIVVLAHVPGESRPNGQQASGQLIDLAHLVGDEVDVIFGGHSHTYLNSVVDGKLLVQAYSYGTAFSDVDIEIDPQTKNIVRKHAEIVTVYQDRIEPASDITRIIDRYEKKVESAVNRYIGTAAIPITAEQNISGESALGNLIADSQRSAMNTDFAFTNPEGIRADIDAGRVTWGNLFGVLPFSNLLVKMDLTGSQIREVLNQQWQPNITRILQISGITYTWDDSRPKGEKVIDIYLPDGAKLEPAKIYSVTVNTYLANGGDNFTVFLNGINRVTGPNDIDALEKYIQQLPQPFSYAIDGRIKRMN
ncbi:MULTISPECIES: bifunctional metallophosphatase/5'-nucleotidase [unclassified Cytobacillus]|uniref:bifunctional metallophosphatase/5'-nucleotidase n=1 Tax=unclassified Cytobacillus TaxID=2675268 RepID=UPI0013FBE911|nr:5'-nucleotidase C-terminal domain-containing protein [Cytobacillus sp. AMY 15.2]KAF0821137.1 5'-nucleotidase [Bacillus sp. ZZV12-4809]MCM3091081.1 5'-nucleotidase C-terminal domain-containing protein [Cytobacillus sp. AMY 15.2]